MKWKFFPIITGWLGNLLALTMSMCWSCVQLLMDYQSKEDKFCIHGIERGKLFTTFLHL